ncbi:hypothetical protein MKW94_012934 [Papaver nudicaule]|uniref:Uncharacterized protein n=1 Tax=Papaver nudicaule TaxID=74823 RepID=A0AA41VN27_PAPNU|nr:hypothetical protein [Papaver nudicaule]
MNGNGISGMENEYIYRHHKHDEMRDNQCSSALVKHIKAPLHLIGSVREVNVKSGLPATTSTERLELLDDEEHILSIRIVGGDHRLQFFRIIEAKGEVKMQKPATLLLFAS